MAKTRRRRRTTDNRDPPADASSLRYIESSALVAALLERDAEALAQVREIGHRVTSALTLAEAARALLRARITGRITPADERAGLRVLHTFRRRCDVVDVSEAVLTTDIPAMPIVIMLALQYRIAEAEAASAVFLSVIGSVITMGVFIALTSSTSSLVH